jgi:hypothetical protein
MVSMLLALTSQPHPQSVLTTLLHSKHQAQDLHTTLPPLSALTSLLPQLPELLMPDIIIKMSDKTFDKMMTNILGYDKIR